MFTGIVEELAQIKTIEPKKQGTRYTIVASTVMDDLKTPLHITEEWLVIEKESLGEDTLIIAKKGAECLQEL